MMDEMVSAALNAPQVATGRCHDSVGEQRACIILFDRLPSIHPLAMEPTCSREMHMALQQAYSSIRTSGNATPGWSTGPSGHRLSMSVFRTRLSRSANRHVNGIPDVILCRLVEHFDLRSRIAFSQACRSLRGRCLAMPSLWRSFDLRDCLLPRGQCQDWRLPGRRQSDMIEWAEQFLRRSEPYTTDVSISLHADLYVPEIGGPGYQTIIKTLERLLSRCDRLAVEFMASTHLVPITSTANYSPFDTASEYWTVTCFALRSAAPMIRSLQLYRSHAEAMDWLAHLPEEFLAGQVTRLSSLYLRGIYLPPGANASLTNLVVLDYDVYPDTMAASELLSTLDGLPALEVLGLRVCDFIDDTCELSPPEGLPQRLHSVALSLIPKSPKRFVTDSITFFEERGIANLAVGRSAVFEDDLAGAWSAFPGAFARPEHLVLSFEAVLAHNAELTRLLLLGTATVSRLCIYPGACAHLVSLTLPEYMWDVCGEGQAAFPPCARLEHLCIVRGRCGLEVPPPADALGIFFAAHDAPCDVPALRELHVVYSKSPRCYWAEVPWDMRSGCVCQSDSDRVMLLEELGRFVRGGLRFKAERLKKLSWACHDRIGDVYPEEALASLWEVAEDVVPMGEVTPEGVRLYDRWTSDTNVTCVFGKRWEETKWAAL